MDKVKSKFAKGAALMVAARMSVKFLGLISTLILVRLLTPRDFGIVALGTGIVATLELLRTFGFQAALISDQEAGPEKYDTAWTINLAVALLLAAVLVLISRSVGEIYDEPTLSTVIQMLAIGVVIRGCENIGIVDLRKNLEFDREFIFILSKKLAGFCVTVSLAFVLRSYWALVFGMLASSMTATLMSYYMSSRRPWFSLAAFKELFSFSSWILINQALMFVRHRSADFVIGKVVSTSAVGIYSVSYEISHMVTSEVIAPVNRAAMPAYAKMKGQAGVLERSYLQVISLIAMLIVPVTFGIAATAPIFVPILLGENWLEAVPIIQILAFAGGLMALETNSGTAYVSLGMPKLNVMAYLVFVPVLLSSMYFLVPEHGALGAAWSSLIASIATLPVHLYLLRRYLGLSLLGFAAVFVRPLLAGVAMFAIVRAIVDFFEADPALSGTLLALAACVVAGAAVYSVVVLACWYAASRPAGAETMLLEQVGKRLRKRKQPMQPDD